ncbi:MAG: methionyl-tRNA formyltransferase [Clostridiales bacterium]|nr:methionyl-tRNA formyltransferase [Clostridiales bacterium]
MRLVFMGTPDFAVPSLTALHAAGHEIVGVFTQPDRPAGRKQVLTPPAVKLEAQRLGLPVHQPETFKNRACEPLLQALAPELIAVVAYGKILPRHVLTLPGLGCVNLHGALLPAYRGAAPIQWAIINGEPRTGVTTLLMDQGVDTGDILLQAETDIGEYETYGELYARLSLLGAPLLVETVAQLAAGTAQRRRQQEALATFAPPLDKALARLDFTRPARALCKLVCGTNPWPVANTSLGGKGLKVFRAELGGAAEGRPGLAVGREDAIAVCCGDRRELLILELQLEGGKRLPAREYLRGRPMPEPVLLGG